VYGQKKIEKKDVTPKKRSRHKSVDDNQRPRRARPQRIGFVAEMRKPAYIELASEKKKFWASRENATFAKLFSRSTFSCNNSTPNIAALRGQESDSFLRMAQLYRR
jgi:hypothetical protein